MKILAVLFATLVLALSGHAALAQNAGPDRIQLVQGGLMNRHIRVDVDFQTGRVHLVLGAFPGREAVDQTFTLTQDQLTRLHVAAVDAVAERNSRPPLPEPPVQLDRRGRPLPQIVPMPNTDMQMDLSVVLSGQYFQVLGEPGQTVKAAGVLHEMLYGLIGDR